jgi:hypothetical protein
MTASVKRTMDDARSAIEALAENMDDEAQLPAARLLQGARLLRPGADVTRRLPAGRAHQGQRSSCDPRLAARRSHVRAEPDHPSSERVTDAGKAWVDSAIAPYLEHVASGIVIVEGYAQQGTRDEQYLRSRTRASIVRDYLIGKFHLDPQATGAMPLGATATGSPGNAPWDGVALAVILPKGAISQVAPVK